VPLHELAPDQRIVPVTQAILSEHGFSLASDHAVLDFGCGEGRHVYEFRDAGFQAFGYDRENCLRLRDQADAELFRFPEQAAVARIPYGACTFDLVISTAVLEHVLDYENAFSETHRVLKPGGCSLHYFPSRYRPIEAHTFVPFGGIWQREAYFLFWAFLGVRNTFQRGVNFREVASRNAEYAKRGVCYLRKAGIVEVAHRHFTTVRFVEDSYLRHCPGPSHHLYPLVRAIPPLKHLYAALHTRVLLLRKSPELAAAQSPDQPPQAFVPRAVGASERNPPSPGLRSSAR